MVMNETVSWAATSNQPLVMLKVDLCKAYDSVEWCFLFRVMEKLGVPAPFIHMVRMLLEGATAKVLLNGASTNSFLIGRGVRQGCPLAPYLYLMVAEALSLATQQAAQVEALRGIRLPDGET